MIADRSAKVAAFRAKAEQEKADRAAADQAPAVISTFQVMPPLTKDELADLEDSIMLNGVIAPITVTKDRVIVDGHHRAEIAERLGKECPSNIVTGTDAELRTLAFSLNLHRRHLTRKQRRELIAASLIADPQLSDREHSRRTGVSDKTVTAIRKPLEESAEIPHFSERIDPRTGKASQPATKPPAVLPDTRSENEPKASDLFASVDKEIFEGALTAARAEGDLSSDNVVRQVRVLEAQHLAKRVTPWSEQIMTISNTLMADELTNEQLDWFWGAVDHLIQCTVIEMKKRGITATHKTDSQAPQPQSDESTFPVDQGNYKYSDLVLRWDIQLRDDIHRKTLTSLPLLIAQAEQHGDEEWLQETQDKLGKVAAYVNKLYDLVR